MAGTTLVTILREPLFHICKDSDDDPTSSGRTYKTDDLHFISLVMIETKIIKRKK